MKITYILLLVTALLLIGCSSSKYVTIQETPLGKLGPAQHKVQISKIRDIVIDGDISYVSVIGADEIPVTKEEALRLQNVID